MTEEAQKAVLQEQDELLAKRQKDLDEVNAKKEAWLQQKLGRTLPLPRPGFRLTPKSWRTR